MQIDADTVVPTFIYDAVKRVDRSDVPEMRVLQIDLYRPNALMEIQLGN